MEEIRTAAALGELRQIGNTLAGLFPYNSIATVAATGRRRKEAFRPGSFRFALDDPERDVFVLVGHDLNQPLGSKLGGSVRFEDGEDALRFIVNLPPEGERPGFMKDTLMNIANGTMKGISPRFVVPPRATVPDAEIYVPEPGNEANVDIRFLQNVTLKEMSIVTDPVYRESTTELRSKAPDFADFYRVL